jgi:hypothetical protein
VALEVVLKYPFESQEKPPNAQYWAL